MSRKIMKTFRVNGHEEQQINEITVKYGLSNSDFIRRIILLTVLHENDSPVIRKFLSN